MPHDIGIIINTRSGGPDARVTEIEQALQKYSLAADVLVCRTGEEIVERTRELVQRKCRLIVAAGGDGTVSAVAGQLVSTESAFGIIPVGTFNHLAQDLHIPLTVEGAVEVLAAGRLIPVDVGTVNNKVFVNNASFGLYPSIVKMREFHEKHGLRKWVALLLASLQAFYKYPTLFVRLIANDGRELFLRTPIVFVGNNLYSVEGSSMGRRNTLQDGVLSVLVAHRPTRLGMLKLLVHALRGTLTRQPEVDQFVCTQLTIESPKQKLVIGIDGEVVTVTAPFQFSILPKAILVKVPQPN